MGAAHCVGVCRGQVRFGEQSTFGKTAPKLGKQPVLLGTEQHLPSAPPLRRFLVGAACLVVRSPERLHLVFGEGGWSHRPSSPAGVHMVVSVPELGGSQGALQRCILTATAGHLGLDLEKNSRQGPGWLNLYLVCELPNQFSYSLFPPLD